MSIVLGTYIDGRPLVYIEATHRFMIGQATVSAAAVRSYDQCGRIRWGQAAQQAWFYQVGAQVFDLAATQQAAAEHTLSSVGGAAQRASNRQPEPAAQQTSAPQHRPSVRRAPVPRSESITRPAISEQDVPPQVPDPSQVPGRAPRPVPATSDLLRMSQPKAAGGVRAIRCPLPPGANRRPMPRRAPSPSGGR